MRDYECVLRLTTLEKPTCYESPWGIMSCYWVRDDALEWQLRIPMRDYELDFFGQRLGFFYVTNPHEGLWGLCDWWSWNISNALRIPMRDYEVNSVNFAIDASDVTNPHEGLWGSNPWNWSMDKRSYESPWGIMLFITDSVDTVSNLYKRLKYLNIRI